MQWPRFDAFGGSATDSEQQVETSIQHTKIQSLHNHSPRPAQGLFFLMLGIILIQRVFLLVIAATTVLTVVVATVAAAVSSTLVSVVVVVLLGHGRSDGRGRRPQEDGAAGKGKGKLHGALCCVCWASWIVVVVVSAQYRYCCCWVEEKTKVMFPAGTA